MFTKKSDKWLITVLAIACLVFPFSLNWLLQIKAFVPVIGDSSTWLSFLPVYLSSIASVPTTYADAAALERDFVFTPKITLREGLRKFAEWYKEYYG